MENLLLKVYSFFMVFGLRIIASLAILILGCWAAKILTNLLRNLLKRSKVDETLISFTGHLSYRCCAYCYKNVHITSINFV